ncbi:MAG: hypothetical protein DRH49_04755, partial [Candidatus Coatesbacteria bacterium]
LIITEARKKASDIIAQSNEQVKEIQKTLTSIRLQRDQYISQFKALIEHHWRTLHQLTENEVKEDKNG